MKKIFFILSLFLTSFAYSQNPVGVPTQITGRWLSGKGYISSDSGFFSRYRDTANKPLSGYWDIRWMSGQPYFWNGIAYISPVGGSSVTSVSGTLNRITSSGGATPVIDIASTYIGQNTITTLGTISTGTWNGTTIAVPNGGTGNTSFTDGYILIGNGTSAIKTSSNLFFNTTSGNLGIGDPATPERLSLIGLRPAFRMRDASNAGGSAGYLTHYNDGSLDVYSLAINRSGNGTIQNAARTTAQASLLSTTSGWSSFVIYTNNVVNAAPSQMFTFTNNFGIGSITAPSARIHLPAGTATASTAPFKYTSGTNLTTPENGAKEYDGSNEFLTVGGVRYTLAKTLTTTATLDFPSTNADESSDLTVSLTGAALGDVVAIGIQHASVPTTGSFMAWVSATDVVSVRFINNDGVNPIDPASGTFRVSIIKY